MIEKKLSESIEDKSAKLAWSQLVERGIGDFSTYLIGTIHTKEGVYVDLRLYKLSTGEGDGYVIYANDVIYNRFGRKSEDNTEISEESIKNLEINIMVDLAKKLKEKGINIKRVNIQASSGAAEKLQEPINEALKDILS